MKKDKKLKKHKTGEPEEAPTTKTRVAIVGGGVGGMSTAWMLSKQSNFDVTIFESKDVLGGHAFSQNFKHSDGSLFPVDLGTQYLFPNSYPNVFSLFKDLGVETSERNLSSSFSLIPYAVQWSTQEPTTYFAAFKDEAQKFQDSLKDVAKLSPNSYDVTVAAWCEKKALSFLFQTTILQPYILFIEMTLLAPIQIVAPWFLNGALDFFKPSTSWQYVVGGMTNGFVKKFAAQLGETTIKVSHDVHSVVYPQVQGEKVSVTYIPVGSTPITEDFDHVVFATNRTQAYNILSRGQSLPLELSSILIKFYDAVNVFLHSDQSVLAYGLNKATLYQYYNFRLNHNPTLTDPRTAPEIPLTTYNIVMGQGAPPQRVQYNQTGWSIPLMDSSWFKSAQELSKFNGKHNIWFCGGAALYDFMEAAFVSGLIVGHVLGGAAYPYSSNPAALKVYTDFMKIMNPKPWSAPSKSKVHKEAVLGLDHFLKAHPDITKSITNKKKVAVLGGGLGSLAAAFYISRDPQYEVTIYQMGWRIGGKAGSGRNAEAAYRIEEHILHIFLGFYRNAFRSMKDVFMNIAKGNEVEARKMFFEIFEGCQTINLMQDLSYGQGTDWRTFNITLPRRHGDVFNTERDQNAKLWDIVWDFLAIIFAWLFEKIEKEIIPANPGLNDLVLTSILDQGFNSAPEEFKQELASVFTTPAKSKCLVMINLFKQHLPANVKLWTPIWKKILAWFMIMIKDLVLFKILPPVTKPSNIYYLLRLAIDLSCTALSGMLAENVQESLDVLDDYNWNDFLLKYGLLKEHLDNPISGGMFSLAFAFDDGDPKKPLIMASGPIRTGLLMAHYVDYLYFRFTDSMGDAIVSPFYRALKNNGVKFKFFHKVQNIKCEGNVISAIEMCEQVKLKTGIDEYDPFIKNCPIPNPYLWPLVPNYDQLDNPNSDLNYENYYYDWQTNKTLTKGTDFDLVVCGISVGGLGYLTQDLMNSPFGQRWKDMVLNMKTVQTCSTALWLNKDKSELGIDYAMYGVTAPFNKPLDTWGEWTKMVSVEAWPVDQQPKTILYMCGPRKDTVLPIPQPNSANASYVTQQQNEQKADSLNWLRNVSTIWPGATVPTNPTSLDWNLLIDLQNPGAVGEARFDSQFCEAWVQPTERYVSSQPGKIKYRLPPGDTGFSNLFVAGDWTKTYLQGGAADAAMFSGMTCAIAVTGDQTIPVWQCDY